MTKEQIKKFVKIRNASSFSSNVQFHEDLREAGISDTELGLVQKITSDEFGVIYLWGTEQGLLIELSASGKMFFASALNTVSSPSKIYDFLRTRVK